MNSFKKIILTLFIIQGSFAYSVDVLTFLPEIAVSYELPNKKNTLVTNTPSEKEEYKFENIQKKSVSLYLDKDLKNNKKIYFSKLITHVFFNIYSPEHRSSRFNWKDLVKNIRIRKNTDGTIQKSFYLQKNDLNCLTSYNLQDVNQKPKFTDIVYSNCQFKVKINGKKTILNFQNNTNPDIEFSIDQNAKITLLDY